MLFSLAPVIALRRLDLTRNLKDSGRQSGFRRRRFSSVLVSAEVALAFVLLLATGLLTRTFVNILRLDPGFHAENIVTFRISVPGYAPLHQLQHNLAALPGVQSVAAISHLPLDDAGNWYDYYWKEGASAEEQNTVMADHRSILPGFFSTIGATLIQGRDFTEADDADHQHVAFIDDVLAHQLWPNADPIGQKLNLSDSPKGFYQFQRDWAVVIGVVRHVQYHSLTAIVRPQIYVPYPLAPRPSMSFILRTAAADTNLAATIRQQVASVSRDMPITRLEPLSTLVDRAHADSRFASLLATLLSSLALLLACIGIYGVLSYAVAQRTMEIGIRLGLGAQRSHVMKMILKDGLAWVLPGLIAGFLLSLLVTPLLARLLFGVEPGSPANYALILAVVLCVSVLAAWLPARRAMKIDPLTALRYE
jgi:predicted permease